MATFLDGQVKAHGMVGQHSMLKSCLLRHAFQNVIAWIGHAHQQVVAQRAFKQTALLLQIAQLFCQQWFGNER